jgi:sugar phosphate isomerase/epimerase
MTAPQDTNPSVPERELKFSLSASTLSKYSLREAAEACRQGGAAGIGFHADRLGGADREAHSWLAGLKVTSCAPEIFTILPIPRWPGPEDPADRVSAVVKDIRRLAAFEPTCVIVNTGPQGDYPDGQARDTVVSGYQQITRAAAEVGVTVAIETFHPRYKDENTMTTTIPEMAAILDAVGAPNMGMVIDVWHLWDSPDLLAQIRAHGDRIVSVQLDDWREPTRSWADRVLPGDGTADFPGILGALDDAGYDGWYDLEVISDDGTHGDDYPDSLWKLDPAELVRRGREQTIREWNRRRHAA